MFLNTYLKTLVNPLKKNDLKIYNLYKNTIMEKKKVFIYDFFTEEKEKEITSIRIYSLDEDNKTCCLRVDDFTPYIYIELPDNVNWDATKAQILGTKLDKIMGETFKAINKGLMYKHKLYGAYLNSNGTRKKFPYLFCSFANKASINILCAKLRKGLNVQGLGFLKLKVHEQDASAILQLVSYTDIDTAGWVKFSGKLVNEDEKITLCDNEYMVRFKNISKLDLNTVGKPKIMGFDIEVNSSNPSAMPSAQKPLDKIFQISCVFAREGCSENEYDIYLLTLGEPNPEKVGDNVSIYMYETEGDLLEGFSELIRVENPNLITGYNILGFDIPYMIDRSKLCQCNDEFSKMGFHRFNKALEKTIKWSSSAYKDQEFLFLNADGRIFVDLLPLVKRDYKMDNYRLKTVSEYFIGDTKNDLSVKGIFKCYRVGTKKESDGSYSVKAQNAMGICGLYCIKDSILTVKLMDKLQTWVGLCEMSKTCSTPIFDLYTRGQQLKVYSQVYKYCLKNNIVVEKDGYVTKDNERYVGAHVFPPIPGNYERVLPFDFCLAGNTLISMSNGLSRRIDSFVNSELIMGYNKECNGFMNYLSINGLQKKGVKETVKIFFQDGRTITSTPDHKFMLEDGSWCEAKNLKDKYVKSGIEYTEDINCEKECVWTLTVNGYKFNMSDIKERDKSLAFSRIIGYIMSDGSIYETGNKKCSEASFGTLFDVGNFMNDIYLICGKKVNIRKRDRDGCKKGVVYCVTLPSSISKMIHSVEDIVIGKRSTQEMKLPKFILEDNCPLSIIREFLGGLYGGDGCAPCFAKRDRFGSISLKWTIIGKFMYSMIDVFEKLSFLHKKLDIEVSIYETLPRSVPASSDDLLRWGLTSSERSSEPERGAHPRRYDIQLSLKLEDTLLFLEKIGFRYCINKSSRLSVAASYQRMRNKTREQHSKVLNRANELIDNVFSRKKGTPTFKDCLETARNDLLENEPAVNIYSLSSVQDIGYRRHEKIRHENKPGILSLQNKKFPSAKKYIEDLNVVDWFCYGDKKVYNVKTDEISVGCMRQKIIDVRISKNEEVFDIEVDNVHNFLANGIVSHNCSLYPTTIIAYNIDFSTIVYDEKIPDSKCHVMKWGDHQACSHDPKVIKYDELTRVIDNRKEEMKELRKNRDDTTFDKYTRKQYGEQVKKKVEELKPFTQERSEVKKTIAKVKMCDERYYRFLKEPKGVIPTILQNLLDARKNTRKEIKVHNNNINNLTGQELSDMKLLLNVLDKRQLAYKVSCNSMYGAYGVRQGYLPFMPGAMCTCYMGRVNIEIVAKTICEKYGGDLVYGDSVTGDTPILCRIDGKIFYRTIDNLPHKGWMKYRGDKEDALPDGGVPPLTPIAVKSLPDASIHEQSSCGGGGVPCNLEVWTEKGFTKIKKIIRHKTSKEIYRVLTHTGIVDVTEDHGLLDKYAEKISPKEINVGTELLVSNLPDNIKYDFTGISVNLAFIMGLFYADGSCGYYESCSKASWALNNADRKLLEKCENILNTRNDSETFIPNLLNFKILETKLVPTGKGVKLLVEKWREMFYDQTKYKKVPDEILWSSNDVRQSFLDGYYAGDGDKDKNGYYRFDNKGKIGASGLYFLANSLGYKVSINIRKDKPEIYRLTCTKGIQRKNPCVVKKIVLLGKTEQYVYDLETENHHFSAGIGQLIVHNTDSNYIHFEHLKTAEESWDHALKVSKEVSALFPPPIYLEFENAIYWKFFILTKKRYMYKSCGRDGVVEDKIGKKGVLLARRDNSVFIRELYEQLIQLVFDNISMEDVFYFLLEELNKLFSNCIDNKKFVITKAVGNVDNMNITPYTNEKGVRKVKVGNYILPLLPEDDEARQSQFDKKEVNNAVDYYKKCLPAVVQLADKMRDRGMRVDNGTRLEYLITDTGMKNAKQYDKLESIEYFNKHSSILKIDFMYYLKLMINPFDEVLNVAFKEEKRFKKDFIKGQYELRKKKVKLLVDLKELFEPFILFA